MPTPKRARIDEKGTPAGRGAFLTPRSGCNPSEGKRTGKEAKEGQNAKKGDFRHIREEEGKTDAESEKKPQSVQKAAFWGISANRQPKKTETVNGRSQAEGMGKEKINPYGQIKTFRHAKRADEHAEEGRKPRGYREEEEQRGKRIATF